MEYKDYYKIMALKRDASPEDIKRSYRKLARKYHPDISSDSDAENKFKELSEAYEVLKDPQKRATYDRLDPNLKAGQEFHTPPNRDAAYQFNSEQFNNINAANFSDFFSELFGQRDRSENTQQGRQFNRRGQDSHSSTWIDLQDTFLGANRRINLQTQNIDNQGKIQTSSRAINIKIPKGIKDGQQIRLAGQGQVGMGDAENGDLYLQIHFNPHRFYRVEGQDLYIQLPVAPWEAALGAIVKLPTPSGTVDLKIPACSNNGSKLRLKGRGIPGNSAGDIYVILTVSLPAATSEQAKALYKEMAAKLAFNPRASMEE